MEYQVKITPRWRLTGLDNVWETEVIGYAVRRFGVIDGCSYEVAEQGSVTLATAERIAAKWCKEYGAVMV